MMKQRVTNWVKNGVSAVRSWPRQRQVVTGLLAVLAIVLGVHASEAWDAKNSVTTYLERLDEGKKIHLKHYVATGLAVGAAINAVLAALLALTARWWLGGGPAAGARFPKRPSSDIKPAVFWLLLGAILLGALALRMPRMDLGIYTDEEYSLRKYVRGIVEPPQAGGEPEFKPVAWQNTVWANPLSNNHVLQSMLSRASLNLWQKVSGRSSAAFDETIFRLPVLVAALVSLVVLALLLRAVGFGRAGILAAALLAIHPWHIRYSTEGRGYGVMLLFMMLGLLFLVRALLDGRWRWWLLFAASQMLMLLAYAGSMYVAAAQCLGAAGVIVLLGRRGYPWVSQGLRLVVAGVLTVMGLLQLQIPWVMQIINYMKGERAKGSMGNAWLQDFWAYLTTGMMWSSDAPENPLHVTFERLSAVGSPVIWVACVVIPLLALIGIVRLLRQGGVGAVLVVTFLCAAPLGYWHNALAGQKLYLWYLLFALPGLFALVALAIEWPLQRLANRSHIGGAIAGVLAAVVVCGFGWLTRPQTEVILTHGKEQFREAIASLRDGKTDPEGTQGVEAMTAVFFSEAPFYDPHAWVLRRGPDVVAAMAEADRSGRPLLVTYGRRALCEARLSDILVYIDDPKLFEPVDVFHGLEEQQFTHYTVRYIGGADTPAASSQ